MSEMEGLIREIEFEVRLTEPLTGRYELAPRVMAAMRAVPRHLFVPAILREQAYVNAPLPLQDGQTISQPYIVALMTDLLEPQPGDRVLEIGTGSGYQTAVLARLVDQVYSLEINADLSAKAAARLQQLGYGNVHCRVADGYAGWLEQAPFDGIMVTAAAPQLPEALLAQLKPGGRLVIPLGPPGGGQVLYRVAIDAQGRPSRQPILDVAFVPMVSAVPSPASDR